MKGTNLFQTVAEHNTKPRTLGKKTILLGIFLSLFSLPFFWSTNNLYNLGGDDSRLYLYAPLSWLKNFALWSWTSLTGPSTYNPQQSYIPFNFLTVIVEHVLFFLNTQKVIYGLTLSLGFLSVYLCLRELIQEKEGNNAFIASIIAGLSYVFLPILFYAEWGDSLSSLYGIFLFPLLGLFFAKAVRQKKVSYLIFGAGMGALFGLSIGSLPWSIAFLIGTAIFLFWYFLLIANNKAVLLRYLVIYFVIFVLINAFWVVPFVSSVIVGGAAGAPNVGPSGKEAAVQTVSFVAPCMSIARHLSGLPSPKLYSGSPREEIAKYTFRLSLLSLLLTVVMFTGLLVRDKQSRREKKLLIALLLTTLALAYFQTVNVGSWGVGVFIWLTEKVPGWTMFRNFYSKFTIAYSFFFCMGLGLSVYIILQHVSRILVRGAFLALILLTILLQSAPFVAGSLNNMPLMAGVTHEKNVAFPEYYMKSVKYLDKLGDGKVLSLPLTFASWSIVKSSNNHNLYIGGSPIKIFTGRDDFNGEMSFESVFIPELPRIVGKALKEGDYSSIECVLGLLNIRYLVYNSEVYDSDIPDSLKRYVLWHYVPGEISFSTRRETESLLNRVARKRATFGPISILELNRAVYRPRVYAATDPEVLVQGVDDFARVIKQTEKPSLGRKVFFLLGPKEALTTLKVGKTSGKNSEPKIDFRRLSPVAYRVEVRDATGPFFLVLSESFHPQWKAYKGNVRWFQAFWEKPMKEERHWRANGYANSWYVDDRGNFEITLYFWPQSLFYVGALISALSVLGAVVYLLYDWRRKWLLREG